MNSVNIIIIYSKHLDNRTSYINSSVFFIKTLIEKKNLKVNINVINNPEEEDITQNITEYNKRVNYNNEDNEDFNKLISALNPNQISNIEKQRNSLIQVKDKEINLIIEDDLIINKDYINNIETLFNNIENYLCNSDILITSDYIDNNNDNLELLDYKNHFKILNSKSSYFINKKTADKLYEYLNVFKYDMRIGLSKFIYDNLNNLNIKIFNKCIFLEGSKVGIFLSSTKNKNFLSQNNIFIEFIKIANFHVIDDEMFNLAEKLYKSLEYLDNSEILHIFGIIYYKRGDYDNAKLYMIKAANNLNKNKGYISKNNDILNNAINIHQFDQPLLNECKKKKSKFSI